MKCRLTCAQIFKVAITMGLVVNCVGGKGRVLHAKAWGEEETRASLKLAPVALWGGELKQELVHVCSPIVTQEIR